MIHTTDLSLIYGGHFGLLPEGSSCASITQSWTWHVAPRCWERPKLRRIISIIVAAAGTTTTAVAWFVWIVVAGAFDPSPLLAAGPVCGGRVCRNLLSYMQVPAKSVATKRVRTGQFERMSRRHGLRAWALHTGAAFVGQ